MVKNVAQLNALGESKATGWQYAKDGKPIESNPYQGKDARDRFEIGYKLYLEHIKQIKK